MSSLNNSVDGHGSHIDQDKTSFTNDDLVNGPVLRKGPFKVSAKEGASFMTLSPYAPVKSGKKIKLRQRLTNFDELFGP